MCEFGAKDGVGNPSHPLQGSQGSGVEAPPPTPALPERLSITHIFCGVLAPKRPLSPGPFPRSRERGADERSFWGVSPQKLQKNSFPRPRAGGRGVGSAPIATRPLDFGAKKRPPTDLWVIDSLKGRERKLRCVFFAGFTGKKNTKKVSPAHGRGQGVGSAPITTRAPDFGTKKRSPTNLRVTDSPDCWGRDSYS